MGIWSLPSVYSSMYLFKTAKELQAAGYTEDGVYLLDLPNLGPRHVYCILNAATDGGGWMLYTSFSSDNPFDSSYPAIQGNNLLVPQFTSNGYSLTYTSNYSDGLNGTLAYNRKPGYFSHFYSGGPYGLFDMTSFLGPVGVTQMRIKHGGGASDYAGPDGNLYTNNNLVYSANNGGADRISVVSFNPAGSTPILRQEETGIAGISWIYVR